MPVPILLVTGALGAGKTTFINRLLSDPRGRRLAVIVNDFGAINIDASVLSSASDDVISLQNGCICCRLQMDLLSTIKSLLRRVGVPDGIVIETSGVSNPAEIIRALMDPVIWKAASLDAVLTVVDGRMLADRPDIMEDALWRAQLQAADFVALSKTDLLSRRESEKLLAALGRHKSARLIYEMIEGCIPTELLFSAALHNPADFVPRQPMSAAPAFQTASWTSPSPIMLDRFQAVIGELSPVLVRAKGIVSFIERPESLTLFQLVGTRATLSRAPAHLPPQPAAQLVFIANAATLDEEWLGRKLNDCRSDRPAAMRLPLSDGE